MYLLLLLVVKIFFRVCSHFSRFDTFFLPSLFKRLLHPGTSMSDPNCWAILVCPTTFSICRSFSSCSPTICLCIPIPNTSPLAESLLPFSPILDEHGTQLPSHAAAHWSRSITPHVDPSTFQLPRDSDLLPTFSHATARFRTDACHTECTTPSSQPLEKGGTGCVLEKASGIRTTVLCGCRRPRVSQ